jgi:hypothetical protein
MLWMRLLESAYEGYQCKWVLLNWLSGECCENNSCICTICSIYRPRHYKITSVSNVLDCLCGLVIRVPGYRCRGPGFNSWRYQIFGEVVCLEWGPLSFVSKTEELLGRNSGSGLENQEYGHRGPLRWPCDILYLQKLALISPTSGGRSVSIVNAWTKAMEFVFVCFFCFWVMFCQWFL